MSSLCSNCLQLAATVSAIVTSAKTNSARPEQPIIHHLSPENERACCKLCALLRLRFGKYEHDEVEVWPCWGHLNEIDINLPDGPKGSQLLGLAATAVRRRRIPSEGPEVEETSKGPVRLQAYCLWDSPAASNSRLSHRYRLHHTGSSDAMELLRTWLAFCNFSHDQCRVGDFSRDILDNHAELPTRVIDVGSKDGRLEPRLLVSNGSKGRWIALSHCWGHKLLWPLSTTRQNFDLHQECIPMNTLPKTFHDAVLVARALGINYLWIDSLCIIQNDENDKKRELPKMGHIYQHAYLTILASEATNCSDGLFFDTSTLSYPLIKHAREEGEWIGVETDSGPAALGNAGRGGIGVVVRRVELPFTHSGEIHGNFFITVSEEWEEKPERFPRFTPLFSRAWVTQEWTLSRRSVLFLRDSIVWSCREYCENDRGACLSLRRPKMEDWQAFIEHYSAGSLTHDGDRLKAIQGLATSLRGKRTDEYFAGLWRGELPDTLLWRVRWDKKVSEELSHVPSWSWARHVGLIGFQLHGHPRFGRAPSSDFVDLVEILGVSHSGALRLRSYLGWVHSIEEFDYHRAYRHKAFLKFVFRGYSSCRQVVPLKESAYAQLEHGGLDREGLSVILDRNGPIGWADWDLGSIPDGPIAWVALKFERDCLKQYARCNSALHVLFLRPEPLSCTEYRLQRVGMGVIGCPEQLSQLERTYLEII